MSKRKDRNTIFFINEVSEPVFGYVLYAKTVKHTG